MLRLLICADSRRRRFIDCIRRICDKSKGKYESHFLPDEVAALKEEHRLERMLEFLDSVELIFMDITPNDYPLETLEGVEHAHLTNQGVLIEYGAAIEDDSTRSRIKLFCESSISRQLLHPYFVKTVEAYSDEHVNDENDPNSLRNKVLAIIEDYEDKIFESQRKTDRSNQALRKAILEFQRDRRIQAC